MNHKHRYSWLLILLTPFFFYITHAFAFFIHEYSHSFSAWMFGFKDNPLILHFGHLSWDNILFFSQMDENVNFSSFSPIHPYATSFIAFAGMGVGNVILFLIAVKALFTKKIHSQWYYYFFIWLVVMNLGNFNDYIPGRIFATHGDIATITTLLNVSPWWIMILFGYPIFYSFWLFYSKILPFTYQKLGFNYVQQVILLFMITFVLFAFFGASGYSGYGPELHLIALLSIYAVPIIVAVCWPLRKRISS